MPIGPTKTKAQKQAVVHTEMDKFKHGTLHSGSKKGPLVHNRKQAIAIAMSESKQSKKGYDRSGHQPGNPGFHREGKPPYREYNAGANAKQPRGKSIGAAPEFTKHRPNQSYHAEQKEHGGNIAVGANTMGSGHKTPPANIDRYQKTKLSRKGPGPGNHSQPQGVSIGAGIHGAEHHKGSTHGGPSHLVGGHPASGQIPSAPAHGFGHNASQRRGPLRMSGHSGAHRVGKR
jgi:hypothetical protein